MTEVHDHGSYRLAPTDRGSRCYTGGDPGTYPARSPHDKETSINGPLVLTAPLSPRQYLVLQAVADGRVRRGILCGTLEPHLLGQDDVIWTLRLLVIRGLASLQPIGPPRITVRGRAALDGPE